MQGFPSAEKKCVVTDMCGCKMRPVGAERDSDSNAGGGLELVGELLRPSPTDGTGIVRNSRKNFSDSELGGKITLLKSNDAKDVLQSMAELATKTTDKNAVFLWENSFANGEFVKASHKLMCTLLVIAQESEHLKSFGQLNIKRNISERSIEKSGQLDVEEFRKLNIDDSRKLSITHDIFRARIDRQIKKCHPKVKNVLSTKFDEGLVKILGKEILKKLKKCKEAYAALFSKWVFALCTSGDVPPVTDDCEPDSGIEHFELFSR
jgi:hypothetical protein